ncbi:hypothetical protein CN540_24240 [Bacillus toyonensis]|nr:hypothetical protein CN633_30505 [Bacillus toyonensis]PEN50107.1 hypothetical protein CN540_24240 [Bacillus toyonensis]PGE05579.1 hypothetical protein COM54_29820 [Bacillus toyonensis]PGE10072.1 hypothetical protein COM64_29515 [Bacillus toyonensis]
MKSITIKKLMFVTKNMVFGNESYYFIRFKEFTLRFITRILLLPQINGGIKNENCCIGMESIEKETKLKLLRYAMLKSKKVVFPFSKGLKRYKLIMKWGNMLDESNRSN